MRSRGYTLVEMLMVLTVFGIVLMMVMLSPRTSADKAASKNLAELIVEELRAARLQARAEGLPVGVAFPSQGGTRPTSRGFYSLEGTLHPRIKNLKNYAESHPDTAIFVGHWSGPQYQAAAPPLGVNLDGFVLEDWGPPEPQDWLFVFTPSGAVLSDRPAFGGSFHVVVAGQVEFADASVRGIPSFELTAASHPYTVSISQLGETTLEKGVVGGNVATAASSSSPPAEPPNITEENRSPILDSLEVLPRPRPESLNAGIDATVKEGEYLTFIATAEDPDGDELLCAWLAEDSEGGFSSPHSTRMQWNSEIKRWQSVWEWTPPEGSAGRQFLLRTEIRDRHGGLVEGRIGVSGRIEVLQRSSVIFLSDRDGTRRVWCMNSDGTNARAISGNLNVISPSVSPDGSLVSYKQGGELWVMNYDGTDARRLVSPADLGGDTISLFTSFSPGGDRIAFMAESGATQRVYIINVDGTRPSNPAVNGADPIPGPTLGKARTRGIDWALPDRLLIGGGPPIITSFSLAGDPREHSSDLYELHLDGTYIPLTSDPSTVDCQPALSPDGRTLAWNQGRNTLLFGDYDQTTSSLTNIRAVSTRQFESPNWSPGGERMVVQSHEGNQQIQLWSRDESGGYLMPITEPDTLNDYAVWVNR